MNFQLVSEADEEISDSGKRVKNDICVKNLKHAEKID
jgi:hypothetical protein